ncbi:MAG: hypothetical protein ACU84Q_07735 [Gammaproteobacteria bacterium]
MKLRYPSLHTTFFSLFLSLALLLPAGTSAQDIYNGTWLLNEKLSDDLQSVMEQVRRAQQEEVDQREEEKQKRTSRPDIFGRDRSWDEQRARSATAIIPKLMRTMIGSENIKIYFSRKLAISYDKNIKRLLTPNPNGRVYSATGAGLSKDDVGETLSYLENNVLFIETRTKIGRLKERIDATGEPGWLTIDWTIEAPAIERPIQMRTVYKKQ